MESKKYQEGFGFKASTICFHNKFSDISVRCSYLAALFELHRNGNQDTDQCVSHPETVSQNAEFHT